MLLSTLPIRAVDVGGLVSTSEKVEVRSWVGDVDVEGCAVVVEKAGVVWGL